MIYFFNPFNFEVFHRTSTLIWLPHVVQVVITPQQTIQFQQNNKQLIAELIPRAMFREDINNII